MESYNVHVHVCVFPADELETEIAGLSSPTMSM